MAMYIDFKKPGDVKVNTICWHTGEPVPEVRDYEVVCVQVDGDEMRMVLLNIQGIPVKIGGTVQIWKAPWAQFIVDNL